MLHLKSKVLQEIEQIPEDKLADLYNFIHQFRLKLERRKATEGVSFLAFAGCWTDLSDEVFDEFIEDVNTRRQNAFARRRAS